MINNIVNLLTNNGVATFIQYPSEDAPLEFAVVESTGSSNNNQGVITYEYNINLYSKNEMDDLQSRVSQLLLVNVQSFNFCGNPVLKADDDVEYVEQYKKISLKFNLDKIKYI